jgi:hypothetical protein
MIASFAIIVPPRTTPEGVFEALGSPSQKLGFLKIARVADNFRFIDRVHALFGAVFCLVSKSPAF